MRLYKVVRVYLCYYDIMEELINRVLWWFRYWRGYFFEFRVLNCLYVLEFEDLSVDFSLIVYILIFLVFWYVKK